MKSTLLQLPLGSGFCTSRSWKPVGKLASLLKSLPTNGDRKSLENLTINLLLLLDGGESNFARKER